jgi:hypothetical protein
MSSSWKPQADYEVPKPLYFMAKRLTSCPQHKRRVIGVLRPLLKMGLGDGRNRALLNKAICFRKELIREGIVTAEAAEELLLMAAQLNGYVAKDGVEEAKRTIRSGLSYEQ